MLNLEIRQNTIFCKIIITHLSHFFNINLYFIGQNTPKTILQNIVLNYKFIYEYFLYIYHNYSIYQYNAWRFHLIFFFSNYIIKVQKIKDKVYIHKNTRECHSLVFFYLWANCRYFSPSNHLQI